MSKSSLSHSAVSESSPLQISSPHLHELSIRAEQPQDQAAIQEVLIQAFLNHPHSQQTEHLIVQNLRQRQELSIALVAVHQQKILGFIAISPVTLNGHTPKHETEHWYGLGPVAVHAEQQGHGIGSTLIRTALNQLQLRFPAQGCVVLGEPEYYGRFGFKAHPHLTLEGVPPEYFQALVFAGTLPAASVSYSPAFAISA